MADDATRRRPSASPYSRTGLFPWGSTYDVPARVEGTWVTSQTPCHLRPVRLPAEDDKARRNVNCPACGRAWTVRVNAGRTPLTATWTA